MRKKAVFIVFCIILAAAVSACAPYDNNGENESNSGINETIPDTNIANISIEPNDNFLDEEHYITYGDSTKQKIGKDYIGLFINGSIIRNADLFSDNETIFVPLDPVCGSLGVQLDLDNEYKNGTIMDGDNKIEFSVDRSNVEVNGKEIKLDASPRLHNDKVYVPLSFAAETLNARVGYFDGQDTSKPHIIVRMPHVMISRYPDSYRKLTEEEAVERVREQLIVAFEKKFGEFVPFDENDDKGRLSEEAYLRKIITNLTVKSENDRYYVIPVVYDFWVDKYRGDVYTFYNGIVMQINIFDPNAEGALAFPG